MSSVVQKKYTHSDTENSVGNFARRLIFPDNLAILAHDWFSVQRICFIEFLIDKKPLYWIINNINL